MVAFPYYHYFIIIRQHYSFIKRFSHRPVYLYTFLGGNVLKNSTTEARLKDLETIAILNIALLLFYFIFNKVIFVFMAFILLIICLAFKAFTSKITDTWLKFSHGIGDLNSKLILSLVYFLFLTPIAIIYRTFAKDHLILKKDANMKSYFYDRYKSYKREDFEKIW